MTDEHRPTDEDGDGTATPWWVGPPREVWDARPAEPTEPPEPAQPSRARPSRDADDTATERYGAVYDVWAPTDTLGREPRPAGGNRTGLLVALAVAIALVAGARRRGARLRCSRTGRRLGHRRRREPRRRAGPQRVAPRRQRRRRRRPGAAERGADQGRHLAGPGHRLRVRDRRGRRRWSRTTTSSPTPRAPSELTFSDGTTTTAKVVGTSPSYDLAVLEVDAKNLPALPLGNSDSVVVGDPVLAIGSPLGLSGTVTSGIVSAKNRPVTAGGEQGGSDSRVHQRDPDRRGHQPGQLRRPAGRPRRRGDRRQLGHRHRRAAALGGESGNIGVGFAIPINQVRRTVEQLIDKGEAEFPIIGASLDGDVRRCGRPHRHRRRRRRPAARAGRPGREGRPASRAT